MGQTPPATCLGGTDRTPINQFATELAHRQYLCARDRCIIHQSSASVHNLPYKLMLQTADWTVHTPDETHSLSGEQNFII